MTDTELSLQDTIQLLDIHVEYVKGLKQFYRSRLVKYRLPNFPEDISENIVKHLIKRIEGVECKREKTKGDLTSHNNELIEVKCFTSDGPSSFGPRESWDCLYFLDAIDYLCGNFKLYKVPIKNDSEIFQSIKVNSKETYGDQCKQKRRPRISFKQLHKQIEPYTQLIFEGNIKDYNLQCDIDKKMKTLSIADSQIGNDAINEATTGTLTALPASL